MTAIHALVFGGNRFPFHRFEEAGPLLRRPLEAAGIDVDLTTDRDALLPASLEGYDVVVDYTTDSTLDDDQLEGLLSFVRDGGGYAGVHCASDLDSTVPGPDSEEVIESREEPVPELRDMLGGHFVTHPEQAAFGVVIVDTHHPVTADLAGFTIWDEPYRVAVDDDVRVLARMDHPDQPDTPVAWATEHGEGRVFYSSLGHGRPALTNDGAQALLVNGVRWAGDR